MIKSTINDIDKIQLPDKYPFLAKSGAGSVVFFTEERVGTVVYNYRADPSRMVGYTSDDWIMSEFIFYIMAVTLENKFS